MPTIRDEGEGILQGNSILREVSLIMTGRGRGA